MAALQPPLGRTVLVAQSHETVTYGGRAYELATCRWPDGVVHPVGHRYIETFRLNGTSPEWTFAGGDALVASASDRAGRQHHLRPLPGAARAGPWASA